MNENPHLPNFNVRINLLALKEVYQTTAQINNVPTFCILIPINSNELYSGDKGIYLDSTAWALKNVKEGGNTHLLKQTFNKETYKEMTDEDKRNIPIIGGLTPFKDTMNFEPKTIETDINI